MTPLLIKVTSPSFSKNPVLQHEISRRPYQVVLNTAGQRLEGKELARYLADADGAIVGLERVTDSLLRSCLRLRAIAKYGVGLDNLDLDACRRRNVFVGWTPGVNRRSVAEVTLGLILSLGHNLFSTSELLKKGTWNKDGGIQLSEKTVGIVGLGNIGKELVTLLAPFKCRVLANDITDLDEYARHNGITLASKKTIFGEADFVTLHLPLTDKTYHLISRRTLSQFRPETFLINTSRGNVVNQHALKEALQARKLAGAALDVYEQEPPSDLEFLTLPNLICTPHISGNAIEAVVAMGRSAIMHLDWYFKTHGSTQ